MLILSLMDYPFTDASMDDRMYKLLTDKPDDFWAIYAKRGKKVSPEFQSMVSLLTAPAAELRAPMADLLGHPWMRGEPTSKEAFTKKYGKIMERTLSTRDNGHEALNVDF